MSEIRFSQRPYKVTYHDQEGIKRTMRRVPPPKLHDALPTDIVELTTSKSAYFEEGEEYSVRHINPRHPNVLQLEDDDGNTTFVDYYDTELEEMVAPRSGMKSLDSPKRNRYLLWP